MPWLIAKETRPQARLLIACALAFGLYGWAVFFASFHHDGLIAPRYNAPGADWIVFYEAARAYLENNLAILYDGARLTALQNRLFADWLSAPLPFHPWIYPPHFLLLLAPFGLLPFVFSYAAFIAVTFAFLICAIRCYAAPRERALLIASALLCPASSMNVLTGQNAFLIAALMIGGLALLPRRPVAAGILFGLMTIKPSLALMLPVALIAAREGRAFAAAAATALALMALSLILFGTQTWLDWLHVVAGMPHGAADYADWQEAGQSWGISVYACALVLGASPGAAWASQAVAALLAGGAVYRAFARPMGGDLRFVILAAATLLAAPHASPYDPVMLGIAATAYGWRMIQAARTAPAATLSLMLWLMPLYNPPRATPLGLLTPVLLAGVIGLIFRQARPRAAASGSAPAAKPLEPARG